MVVVYVLDIDAIETTAFKWVEGIGPLSAEDVAWFDDEVAEWAGQIVRVRIVQLVVYVDRNDTAAIQAEIARSLDLVRASPPLRSYEHPAWFHTVRAFNIAQAEKGSDVD